LNEIFIPFIDWDSGGGAAVTGVLGLSGECYDQTMLRNDITN
jgi:hypothetical protein